MCVWETQNNGFKIFFLIITSLYCLLINGPIPRKDNEYRIYSVGTTQSQLLYAFHTHTCIQENTFVLFDSNTFLFIHVC